MKPAPPVTRIFTPEHLESRVSPFTLSASYTIDGTQKDVRERTHGVCPFRSKKDRRGLHEGSDPEVQRPLQRCVVVEGDETKISGPIAKVPSRLVRDLSRHSEGLLTTATHVSVPHLPPLAQGAEPKPKPDAGMEFSMESGSFPSVVKPVTCECRL